MNYPGNRTNRRGHGCEPERFRYGDQMLTIDELMPITGLSRSGVRHRLRRGLPLTAKDAKPEKPAVQVPALPPPRQFAMGMKANLVRRKVGSFTTASGERLVVGDVSLFRDGGWYQAETNDGPRWARVHADGSIVDVQKFPPGGKT